MRERVMELLSYDPSTGEFRWKVRTSNRAKPGQTAGAVSTHSSKKYRRIMVDGKLYFAHRLAWLISYGQFPDRNIDHVDGNGLNNRLDNLRIATPSENCKNQRRRPDNTSGITGVSWYRAGQKWHARIAVNRRTIHLGYFSTKEEAVAARKAAEVRYGFHANHGQDRPL